MTTKVILVDDHHVFRTGLRAILASEPDLAVVGEASEARQAYSLLDSAQPDLVLLDLTLDNEDGFEVFKSLRAVKGCADLVVIALTAHNFPEIELHAKLAGFAGFVTKPIDFEGALFPLMRHLFRKNR